MLHSGISNKYLNHWYAPFNVWNEEFVSLLIADAFPNYSYSLILKQFSISASKDFPELPWSSLELSLFWESIFVYLFLFPKFPNVPVSDFVSEGNYAKFLCSVLLTYFVFDGLNMFMFVSLIAGDIFFLNGS